MTFWHITRNLKKWWGVKYPSDISKRLSPEWHVLESLQHRASSINPGGKLVSPQASAIIINAVNKM